MPKLLFTGHLRRYLPVSTQEAAGDTVRAALESAFARQPRLRGYVLDEQGALRRHVAIYVNDQPLRDRTTLSDAVAPTDEIHVLQALSGG